ncbi:P-loop containing nucleoside triphosphate hydrolase protein [Agrocybe pediades]|nr:P-loop containing nucleoside triphosphate hydrolase protein [Agrocybe pediades]
MQCFRRLFSSSYHPLIARRASTSAITLRPYQETCLQACTAAIEAGSTRIGVSLPTGSGKTTVFISLLSRIPPPAANERATKSLIIVNSIELARQSAQQVGRLFPDWHVEIEQGSKYQASGQADVTVATYQTLNNDQRLLKFDPQTMKAIIVDEAHHAAAPSYRRILARFDPDIKHKEVVFDSEEIKHKIPIIGFSATFGRHDGLALGSIFEQIVYHRPFSEMIQEAWLCDVRFTTVKAKMNLREVSVNSATGDYSPTSLARIINSETMNELVVKAWLDRAASRKSTLIFCVNVAHVQALTQTFRRFGIDARYLTAKTPVLERKTLVQSFRDGEFPVLVNCAILTEGADIPNIDCVVIARPTRSRNLFSQMIGRGMRLSPNTGKTDCRIIDFVDTDERLGGLVTSPTLFGLDPLKLDVDDEDASSLEQRAAALRNPPSDILNVPRPISVEFTDHVDPFALPALDGKAIKLARLSRFAYVDCGNEIYVLELLTKGFIRIERGEHNVFVARYTPAAHYTGPAAAALKLSPFHTSREIVVNEKLEDVIHACDTYVINNIFRNSSPNGLLRSAAWRRQPASEAQLNFIKKRWEKQSAYMNSDDREEMLENMTKGGAAIVITRLRNGSQARFIKKAKVSLKEQKEAEKELQRQAREVVKVGYLPV